MHGFGKCKKIYCAIVKISQQTNFPAGIFLLIQVETFLLKKGEENEKKSSSVRDKKLNILKIYQKKVNQHSEVYLQENINWILRMHFIARCWVSHVAIFTKISIFSKFLPILHEEMCDNYFIVKCLLKSNHGRNIEKVYSFTFFFSRKNRMCASEIWYKSSHKFWWQ